MPMSAPGQFPYTSKLLDKMDLYFIIFKNKANKILIIQKVIASIERVVKEKNKIKGEIITRLYKCCIRNQL
jgi:hypothetical protein